MPDSLAKNVKLIGRYSVLRELRRDRYTVAYLAFDPVLNRELVVKAVQLQPRAGHDSAGHERIEQAFMRQAQAAGRLHHPHIVTVFDAGRFRDLGYLALERVDGKLLSEAMAEGFQPGFLQAADIAARVADAVEYAHARGVPHGHLAPSRIYLQGVERTPRVMGFGGWIDSGTTGDFELAGTQSMLPYFQNELSSEARRKDVRALGALLFRLLTGTRPDANALRSRKAVDSPVLDLRPDAPVELAEIAENALGLSGSRPFGTAAQFRNALTTYLWGNRGAQGLPSAATITGMPASMALLPGKEGAAAIRAPRPVPTAPTSRSRSNLVAIGVAACALALIGAFAVASRNAKPDPAPFAAATALTPSAAPMQPTPPSSPMAADQASSSPPAMTSDIDQRVPRSSAPAAQRAARNSLAPAPARGVIAFAVAPWGEVYVNGTAQGTTPPLTQLLLPAGRHTIELRNGQRQPFIAQVDVSPDRPQRISHRFQ
jgi:serine/threonine-protein kinase